jgi:PEP-CTERM motif
MKKIAMLVAIAAFSFMLVSPGHKAHANTVNLGPLTPAASVGVSQTHFGAGSVFSDVYSFSVTADASLQSILAAASFTNIVGISNFTSSLWLSGGGLLAAGNTFTSGSGGATTTTSSIFYSLLTAGVGAPPVPSYEIRTSGTIIGPSGSYGGSVVIAPIPEPEIYAMMAVGLGLLGWVRRRRKSQTA